MTEPTIEDILQSKFWKNKKHKNISIRVALECLKIKAVLLSQFKHLGFYKDKSFILEAARLNPFIIRYMYAKFKKDYAFMKELLNVPNASSECYRYASYDIQQDKEFKLNFIDIDIKGTFKPHIKLNIYNDDDDITFYAIKKDPEVFKYLRHSLQTDIEYVKKLIRINPLIIQYILPEFKRNKEVMRLALKTNGLALKYLERFTIYHVAIAVISNRQVLKYLIYQPCFKNMYDIFKRYIINHTAIQLFASSCSYYAHRRNYTDSNKRAKTTNNNILDKLNHNGYHHGIVIKSKIVEYIGVYYKEKKIFEYFCKVLSYIKDYIKENVK
jgi:hypothetical protein